LTGLWTDVDVDMDVLLLHIMPLSIFGVCACSTAGLAGSNDSVWFLYDF